MFLLMTSYTQPNKSDNSSFISFNGCLLEVSDVSLFSTPALLLSFEISGELLDLEIHPISSEAYKEFNSMKCIISRLKKIKINTYKIKQKIILFTKNIQYKK